MDEPLEGMDRNIQKEILEWIFNRKKAEASIVVVSHTIEPFIERTSKAWALKDGGVIMHDDLPGGTEERLFLPEALSKGKSL